MVFSSNELNLLVLHDGKDGVSVDSKYTWIKYSQNSDGSLMTDDPTDAIYMGLAYNKDSIEESSNPLDYTWIKIKGETGQDAYTIVLTNENVSFSVDNSKKPNSNQVHECQILVFKGIEVYNNFTIDKIDSDYGITVAQSNNLITLSADTTSKITQDSGNFKIKINIDELVFYRNITWSLSIQGIQGEQGQQGISAFQVILQNESQSINCTSDGLVNGNILLKLPFTAFKGYDQVESTAIVKSILPNGVTVGSNTPSTSTTNGEIIFNITDKSDLGGKQILSGDINIEFSILNQKIIKKFSWTKVLNGENGMTFELELSTNVIERKLNGGLSCENLILKAFKCQDGNREPYNGRFQIESSIYGTLYIDEQGNYLTDGVNYLKSNSIPALYKTEYVSSEDEYEHTFVFEHDSYAGLQCYLYESDSVTKLLDKQSVIFLRGNEEIEQQFTQVATNINGVDFKVDSVNNQIINKIWQTDITTQINNYDGTTVKSMRDQITEQKTELGKITDKVSDVESTFSDGLQTLTERVSTNEQTVDGFKQTVEETYTTKSELGETTTTLRSEIKHEAGLINQTISTLEGDISNVEQTANSVKTEVTDARGGKTSLNIRLNGMQSEVTDNNGKISLLEQNVNSFKTEVSNTYLSKTGTGGLEIKMNYSNKTTPKNNWISIHSKSDTEQGWITWNDDTFPVEDYSIDTKVVPNTNLPIYIVLKILYKSKDTYKLLTNESGDVLVNEENKQLYLPMRLLFLVWFNLERQTWECYSVEEKVIRNYVWENDTDAILAYFSRVLPSAIDTSKVYSQPVLYDEIKTSEEQKSVISQTAEGVMTQVENVEKNLKITQSTIKQLSDSISSLVVDENGNSLMDQTTDGWSFNIESINKNINVAKEELNKLSGRLDKADAAINGTNNLVNDITSKTAYMNITTYNGQPAIELGSSASDFKLRITNTSIDFLDGSSRVAYISNKVLYIERVVIKNELQIGEGSGFIFKKRASGNVGIRATRG